MPDVAERPVAPAIAIALGAGVLGGVQPKLNAVLGDRIGSSVVASLVNFGVAFAVVVVVCTVRTSTRGALARWRTWPVPRWTFAAGLGGALVVLSGVVTVETIGVATFSVAFFGGQLACGLLVDRVGIGPGGPRPIVAARAQAAVIAMAAVVVSQLGRQVGDFAPALVAFAFTGGAASALQSACNGRIVVSVGDRFVATAVNVSTGAVALALTVGTIAAAGALDAPDWPSEPWLYAGGLLGVSIVLALSLATAALGVLRTTVAMLAAQLITAFVVDWVVYDDGPTPGVLTGAALVVVAVARLGAPARKRTGSLLSRR